MGHPKFPRKKYDTPPHPWQKDRIERENELLKKYGLKNKREIWKAESILRKLRRQARVLLASVGEEAKKEERELIQKLQRLGLLKEDANLDNILELEIQDILDRRLQSVVFRRGLAKTPKEARQMIVHRHVKLGDRVVTSPGMLILKSDEELIQKKEA
ncbi:MAG: 30S ribosomal protein S4 [Methanomicrobia archaeon]|nr:30S ribosomal protein S4 [Methanomicrobia archaeon]HDM22505.1 30S ribosomal protein S4 [Methanomicrobia archaeon]